MKNQEPAKVRLMALLEGGCGGREDCCQKPAKADDDEFVYFTKNDYS